MELVITRDMFQQQLFELIDVGNLLAGAKVELFTNDVQPTRTSIRTDFDVPTYSGYADETIAWNVPSLSDDGTDEVVGIVGEFRPTNGDTPNTVFGAIVKTAGGLMLMGGRFDGAPLPMVTSDDAIVLTVRYRPESNSIAIVIS